MKLVLSALLLPFTLSAQTVKPIPPPGIEVPATDRADIESNLKQLGAAIEALRKDPKNEAELPNVEIYFKSADWALRYNEIFDPKQIPVAKEHIKLGLARAASLAKGQKPWNAQTGLVARGYRSRIDGSVQPYGVLIPDDFKEGDECAPYRLDFWCHGRAEKLSELSFIEGVQKSKGEFTPPRAILCQLYGRYCNANKFAGEMDLFEVLEDIKKHYPIDEKRLVIRGFSMGGAACWQFATHYAGLWAAAAPGAGFAETAEFFKALAPGKEVPPAWEQKLWRWYDATTVAVNLSNTATVAYSGEKDGQKQAAEIMIKYAEKEGVTIPHIIGPDTAHKYHPDSKPKINELVDAAVKTGNEAFPKKVRFTTYTLIYPKMEWITVTGLEKHWERADVEAERIGTDTLDLKLKNVTSVIADIPADFRPSKILVNGKEATQAVSQGRSSRRAVFLRASEGRWIAEDIETSVAGQLRKTPSVCGPIDHAFMSRFVFVRPTGKPLNDAVGAWAKAEMEHAIVAWRKVYRGDAQVIDDTKVTPDLIKNANLVLWGDPSSNKVLAQILPSLPLKWDAKTLALGTQSADAANNVAITIYPNPLNPSRYVILNSGFTFREFALLNNSDQTPKLPDWAVVDITTPHGPKWPGKVVDAGFFDEQWKVAK